MPIKGTFLYTGGSVSGWRYRLRSIGRPKKPCRICGKPESFPGEFSARGKHLACSLAKQEDFNIQMHKRSGPEFQRWRLAMAKAVGVHRTADGGWVLDYPDDSA